MKKLLFLLLIWIYPMVSFSAIDECKTDVYFANGILTKRQAAKDNAEEVLKPAILAKIYNGNVEEFNKHIGKVDYAYNETNGFFFDNLESAFQKFGIQWLIDRYALIHGEVTSHFKSITEQINAYKGSIRAGHKVLVVAHSQGNLFTYAAYDALPGWMHNSFEAISIASPMTGNIKQGTPRFDWDNDLVPRIASLGDKKQWMIEDPVRKVSWESEPYIGKSVVIPTVNYVWSSQVGRKYKERYKAVEAGLNSAVHAFTFYMGKPLISDKTLNPFDQETLHTDKSKTKIMAAIKSQLNNGRSCPCSSKSVAPIIAHNGAIEVTLSWDHQCDVDMDLEMTGSSAIIQDIKDVEDAGKEHAYIESAYQIHPGDHYEFFATGSETNESRLDIEALDEDPIQIRALLETPTGDYFKVWEAQDVDQLNIGKFAELDVEEKIIPKWVCPALSNTPGWYNLYNQDTGGFDCVSCSEPYEVVWYKPSNSDTGHWRCNRPGSRSSSGSSSVRTYNHCADEEKKSSCGCVPCDYIVSGMERRVENGPIAGAEVEIIKVMDADAINPQVLYRGETTDDDDLFKSGLIDIPGDTLEQFEDETYYLVTAKGGADIDRDDDMVRNPSPTENHGMIHVLIKGSELKQLPFRINILTEAIYQVSGDVVGSHYDADALERKLDNIAVRLLNRKLYPGDDDNQINYKDILLWTPAVDKKALYKPFDQYVEPIIEKLYSDSARYDESYRLIYESYDSNAPQLTPLSLEIPEGLANTTIIAEIKTQNSKTFTSIELTGRYADHFSVDDDGYLRIANTADIKEFNRYRLQVRAIDAEGRTGTGVSLDIKVTDQMQQADPSTSTPILVSLDTFDIDENAPEGTKAAEAYFEDSNQSIIGYRLTGEDSSLFTVDEQGIVYVAADVDIDYEHSKLYHFSISAYNDAGNESYPVKVSISIRNLLDTPLFDLVFFEHVMENIDLGTVLGHIEVAREGLGTIEKFEILSPHIPFKIDSNGTVTVTDFIDYEQVRKYDFYAIARTQYGSSNKVEFHIVVDDQEPEVGLPTLEGKTIAVDENVTGGTAIAQLNLDNGAESVTQIALYGEDEIFRIDANGTVYLAANAKLDYETKQRYDLGARALSSRGYGNEVHIIVNVNNIADELPTLGAFRGAIVENASSGTFIGNIQIGADAEVTIDSIVFNGEGSEDFVIDNNGSIHVSNTAQLDYENQKSYLLKAVASSDTGFISEGEVIISLYNIPEFVPVLKPLNISVEERAGTGTVVGTMQVEYPGDTAILSFDLNETSVFSIDNNGILRLEALLDYSMQSHYGLEVNATNDAGTSDPVTVNITVLRYFYTGDSSDNQFTGSSRSEKFDTKEGDDLVDAGAGDDIITGGRENDILRGGYGDDTYTYDLGDGNDTIEDREGNDRLILHNIEKESLSFGLTENDLVIHIGEDNSTIVIQNWKNDSYKIENIVFDDDTEISLEDFNLPLVEPDAGIADLSKLGNINAQQVVEGRIVPIASGYNSVDHWIFNYSGGTLEIDLLSELASNGETYIDIDRDGEQTGVDVYIYLFIRDPNDNWQYVVGNDDSSSGRADGSSHRYDSYLNINLQEGEYMLAVSNYNLSSSVALGDRNSAQRYPNGGPYQISFNEILEFSQFPENANDYLYGSDHYNFYVLRNDMDPYNIDGLRIADLNIVDENGTNSDMLGTVQTEGMYISYYPETYFEDLDRSVEINILYDVINQNGISAKSILTLQIIPSLYTHIEPTVNQILWEDIKSENSMSELNITKE